MIIKKSPTFVPAFKALPGTPIVALDREGLPTAVGVHLSADPEQRSAQLAIFASHLLKHSAQIGDIASAVSAGLDMVGDAAPAWAGSAGEAGSVVAFVGTGIGFANAVEKNDGRAMLISGFKFGANALDLLDKTGLLGTNPNFHLAISIAKAASAFVKAVPEGKEAATAVKTAHLVIRA